MIDGRRVLLLAGLSAHIWMIVITVTGGFVVRTAWLSASSRNPRGPLTVALVAAAIYAIRYRQHWAEDVAWLARPAWPRAVAAVAVCGALVAGIGWGTFIGGGPDASGYVSQADMWVRGVLTLPAPDWARTAPWPDGVWSSSPIGYGPSHSGDAIAPMYSPGLPLMMALFQRVGGPDAVYAVVPLLGAVAVWGSFLLGRRISGDWAGAIAAVLVACSPPFLWMIVQPMSDVPVAACWTMALVIALRPRRADALASGVATAAAILVRPNVVPLAIFPALLLLTHRDDTIRRLTLFAIVPVMAAAAIASLNWYLNGSPLRSGYGSLEQIYSAQQIPTNLQRYSTWLLDAQTPLMFLGLAAPCLLRREAGRLQVALVVTVYPMVVLGLYLPYAAFDHWSYLRFLLPGYPAVLAGVGVLLVEAVRRSTTPLVAVGAVTLVAFVALHGWQTAHREAAFQIVTFDRRYARAVDYVKRLPSNAVIVSNVHSGTLRFYTGREVLRFEVMRPEDVDRALAYLREHGHPVYFVGDPDEVDYFKDLFRMTRATEQLTGGALADLGGVVVYALN